MSNKYFISGGTLDDGSKKDLFISDGKISGFENPANSGAQIIDATGDLVSPPFVDPHFHMDATLSLGLPRLNMSGTLLEGISLWGELKPLLTQEALVERALAYCDWAVARGLLAIRTHVDVCDPRLLAGAAVLTALIAGRRAGRCARRAAASWTIRRISNVVINKI